VVNHRQLDHLDQFLMAEVIEHAPEVTVGLAAARQTLAAWLAAFPDLHLVIEDLVVDGDRLMARLTATGTHLGARVRLPVYEAWAMLDGRCAERWLHIDRWELRCQLGLPEAGRESDGTPPRACGG
jgi:predicted ester cyclase